MTHAAKSVTRRLGVGSGSRINDSSVDIRFISLAENSFAGPYQYNFHQHVHQELIFVTDGNYRCTVNKREICVGRGALVVVDPGDWHQDFCEPPLRYFAMHIRIRHVLDQASEPGHILRDGLSAEEHAVALPTEVFLPLLNRIWMETQDMDRFAPAIQESMAREMFWRILRYIPIERLCPQLLEHTDGSLLYAQLKQLFSQEMHSSLNVSDMAKALGMSVSSLAHRCREQLGTSPARAYVQFRMQKAAELLCHTSMSVREVSDYLGFENQYHFSRVFKSVYDAAPSNYRDSSSSAVRGR